MTDHTSSFIERCQKDFRLSVAFAVIGILMIEIPRYCFAEPMKQTVANMLYRFQMEHYPSPYTHLSWGFAGSVLLMIAAYLLIRNTGHERIPVKTTIFPLLMAAVIVTGTLLRVIHYSSFPHGLWIDNGMAGLHSLTVLKYHECPIYFHSNYGYEPINPYLISICIALLGNTAIAIRLPALLISLATLFVCARFTRLHFGRFAALAATAFMSLSLSHNVLSRQGFRCILMPLFAMLIMDALLRAFKEHRPGSFHWAGFWLGLSMYSYVAVRFFIFIPVLMIIHQLVFRRMTLKKACETGLRIFIPAGVIVLPLLIYFVINPNLFSGRAVSTVVFQQPEPWRELWHNTRQILGMFSLAGDLQPRHNIVSLPLLNPLESVFFIMGLFLVIHRFKTIEAGALVIWMIVMMVPSWITEGAPSFMRLLSMFPAVWVVTALGLETFSDRCGLWMRRCRSLIPAAVFLFGLAYSALNIFGVWRDSLESMPDSKRSHYGFCEDEFDLSQVIVGSPDIEFVVSPQIFLHPSVQYLCYGKKGLILNSDPKDLDSYMIGKDHAVFIYTSTERNLWWLRTSQEKDFFFWQKREYGLSDKEIRDVLTNHYGTHLPVMASDQRLKDRLLDVYPDAPEEQVGIFTIVRCHRLRKVSAG